METESSGLSIKAWAEEDRPREKLLLKGRHALSDAELLAILIRSGSRGESAVQLCQRILGQVGNDLNELGRLSVEQLIKVKGIGKAKAIAIVAALELGRRRQSVEVKSRAIITGSKDIFEYMAPQLIDLDHEEFHVMFLNRSNRVIKTEAISSGGMAGTIADPRMIFRRALELKAIYIAVCHNHPSGNVKPSPSDLRLTRSLSEVGKMMDITLLDHVIIGGSEYYSFADEGKLT